MEKNPAYLIEGKRGVIFGQPLRSIYILTLTFREEIVMKQNELVVAVFDEEKKADRVLDDLFKKKEVDLVDFKNVVVVIKDKNGVVRLNQSGEVTPGLRIFEGWFIGGFAGLLVLLNPVATSAIGGILGALYNKLHDVGIDDSFIETFGEKLVPGTSAIFVLVKQADDKKVIKELETFGGKVLQASLSENAEQELIQEALDFQRKEKE